jgi:hypothetical protein
VPDAQSSHITLPQSGSWDGLDETGATSEVVDCLNVDFDRKLGVRRKPGRALISGALAPGMRVSGLFEYVERSGARRILVALQYDDPSDGAPKLGLLDEATMTLTDLSLPSSEAMAEPSRGFSASAFGSHILLADPFGRLLDYDASALSILDAMQGQDVIDSVPGARAYLEKPPPSRYLTTWRGRLVSIEGYRVALSADSNDLRVPAAAPAGGANVWPFNTYFAPEFPEGETLEGCAVQNDLLVVFSRRCIAVVDEDELSPIARIVERQLGCTAPNTIKTVGGDVIMYLSDRKVCAFAGGVATIISDEIRPTLEDDVNWAAAAGAVAVHYASRGEYRIYLPVNGSRSNRLCLIYDYQRKRWRKHAGWYLWDTEARQSPHAYDVTAALATLNGNGQEMLITGDSQGRIWREDVGETDNGTAAPAYFVLRPLGDGEKVASYGAMRPEALMDGSFVEILALRNGTLFPQEATRVLEGAALKSHRKVKRALGRAHTTFDAVTTWGVDPHAGKHDRMLFPFRVRATRLQPVISLPGASGATIDSARGGVRSMEITVKMREGRRGEH